MKNLNLQLKLINDVFDLRCDESFNNEQRRFFIKAYCSLVDGVCNVFNLELWEVIELLDSVEDKPLMDAHVKAWEEHKKKHPVPFYNEVMLSKS